MVVGKNYREEGGKNRGDESGHGNADPFDRPGQAMGNKDHDCRGQEALPPEPGFEKQLEAKQAGNDGPAQVYCQDGFPLLSYRDPVANPKILNPPFGHERILRDLFQRDIDEATDQYEKKGGEDITAGNPHLGEGQGNYIYLNDEERKEDDTEKNDHQEKSEGIKKHDSSVPILEKWNPGPL